MAEKRHRLEHVPANSCRDIRVGPLLSIPSLLKEHELDPALILSQVGLDTCLFDDAENRVSFADLGKLLETCVALSRCPHFGLLIGQRFKWPWLGALGGLMHNCPTVRDALRLASLHLEFQDRGAVSLTLDLGGGKAALAYSLLEGKTPAIAQILDGAIAMQYLMLQELCGPTWKPVLIQLSHSPPADTAPFRKHFHAPMEFNAPISAIVFESRWLDHCIEGADSRSFANIRKTFALAQPHEGTAFTTQARRALVGMIFTDSASVANLARVFNMNERTLRRRLDEERETVRRLLNEARCELAHHLLRGTNLPVTEIAAALRYSDLSVFARAFRGWSHMNPREWRAKFTSAI